MNPARDPVWEEGSHGYHNYQLQQRNTKPFGFLKTLLSKPNWSFDEIRFQGIFGNIILDPLRLFLFRPPVDLHHLHLPN